MLSRDVPSSWAPRATVAPPAPRLCAPQPPLPCMGLATSSCLQTLRTGAGASLGQVTEEAETFPPAHPKEKSGSAAWSRAGWRCPSRAPPGRVWGLSSRGASRAAGW